MYALILFVVIGLGMAYFSTQNMTGVSITLANYTLTGIPLYIIVIGSLLIGIVMSWVIHSISAFSSMMTIHGKNTALQQADARIAKLQVEKNSLLLENARLQDKPSRVEVKKGHGNELQPDEKPSFLSRFRQPTSE